MTVENCFLTVFYSHWFSHIPHLAETVLFCLLYFAKYSASLEFSEVDPFLGIQKSLAGGCAPLTTSDSQTCPGLFCCYSYTAANVWHCYNNNFII